MASYPNVGIPKETRPKLLPIYKYFKINSRKFLLETSLNGLKYVYDRERNIWERSYYLISFTLCFTAGIYMAFYFLLKWQSTPVIISLSSETTSIQDIPFPAVTFCNMNQALRSKVEKFDEKSPDYALLQNLCFQDFNYSGYRNFQPRHSGDTFANFIIQNTQSCEDMIIFCKFGPNEETCTDLFREVLLDEGMCCVFNQMHPFFLYKTEYKFIRDFTSSNGRTTIPVQWDLAKGYTKPLPKVYSPRPAPGSGVSMGLTVVLNADLNEYYCSSTNGPGFKMLLYNPIDEPHIKDAGLPIMLGHQTRVRINAKRTESTTSLRTISVKDRQCYFGNEKQLRYFKYYTRRNCEMECDAELILRQCSCIPFNMAMVQANASVCFLQDMDCVDTADSLILDKRTVSCKANCLSGCNELSFFPDFFVAPLAVKHYILQDNFFRNKSKEWMEKDLAQVQFYFKENFFRGNTKVPYTGFTEFMSQTGGAMSLMVGFSVISIAETFYFIMMKPFFDMILRRDPKKLDITDDQMEEDEQKQENNPLDKFHYQMLFKRRKPIHNHPMEWNKEDLHDYQEKQENKF